MGKKKSLFGWMPWFRKCKKEQTTENDNKPTKSSTLSLKAEKKEKKGKTFSSLPDIFRAAVGKKKTNKTPVDTQLGVRTLQKEASKSSISDDELNKLNLPPKATRSRSSSTSTSNSEIGKERPLQKFPTPRKKKRTSSKTKLEHTAVINEIRTSEQLEFSAAKLSLRQSSSSSSSESEAENMYGRISMNLNRPALPIKKKDIVVNAPHQGNTEPTSNNVILKHIRSLSSSSSSAHSKKKSKVQTRTVSVQVNMEPAVTVPFNLNSHHKNRSSSSCSSDEDVKTYATPVPRVVIKHPILNEKGNINSNNNVVTPVIKTQETALSQEQQPLVTKTTKPSRKYSSSSSSSENEVKIKNKLDKVETSNNKKAYETAIVITSRPHPATVVTPPLAVVKTPRKDSSSSSSSSQHHTDEKNKKPAVETQKLPDYNGQFQSTIVTPHRTSQNTVVKYPAPSRPIRKDSSSSQSSQDEKKVKDGKKLPDCKGSYQTTTVTPQRPNQEVVVTLPATIKPSRKESSSSSSSDNDIRRKGFTLNEIHAGDKNNTLQKLPQLISMSPTTPVKSLRKDSSSSSSSSHSDSKNKTIKIQSQGSGFPSSITIPQRPAQEVVVTLPVSKPDRKDKSSSSSSSDTESKNTGEKHVSGKPSMTDLTPQRPVVTLPAAIRPGRMDSSTSSSSSDTENKNTGEKHVSGKPSMTNLTPQRPVVTLPTIRPGRKDSSSSSSSSDTENKNKKNSEKHVSGKPSITLTPQRPLVTLPTIRPGHKDSSSSSSSSDTENKNKNNGEKHVSGKPSITLTPQRPLVTLPATSKPGRKDSSSSSSSSSLHTDIKRVENVARISIISSEMSQLESLEDEAQHNIKIIPEQKPNVLIRQKSISSISSDDNNVIYENVIITLPSTPEKKIQQKYDTAINKGSKYSSGSSSSDSKRSPKSIRIPVPKIRLKSIKKETTDLTRKSSSSSNSSHKDVGKINPIYKDNITEVFPVIKSSLSGLKMRKHSSESNSSEKSDLENSPHRYFSAEENVLVDGDKTQSKISQPITEFQNYDTRPQVMKRDSSNSSSDSTLSEQVNKNSEKTEVIKSKLKSSSSDSSIEPATKKNSFRTKAIEYSKMLQEKINKKFSSQPHIATTKPNTEITKKSDKRLPNTSVIIKIDSPKFERERSSSSSGSEKSNDLKLIQQKPTLSSNSTIKKSSSESSITDHDTKSKNITSKPQEYTMTVSPGPSITIKHSSSSSSSSSDSDSANKTSFKDKLSHLKDSLEANISKKLHRKDSISSNSSLETPKKDNKITIDVQKEKSRSRSSSESSVDSQHRTRKDTEICVPTASVVTTTSHGKRDSSSSSSASHEDISQGGKKTFGAKVKEISGDIQKLFKGKPKIQPHDSDLGTPVISVTPPVYITSDVSKPESRVRSNSVLSTSSHSTVSIGESTDASSAQIKTKPKSKVGNVFQHMREKRHKKTHKKTSSGSSFSLDSPKLNIRHKAKEFSDELKQKLQRKPKTIMKDKTSDSDTPQDEDTLDSNKFIESLYEGAVSREVDHTARTQQSSSSSSDTSNSDSKKTTDTNTVTVHLPDKIKLQQINRAEHLSSKSSSESSLNSTSKPSLKTQTKDIFKNMKHKIRDKKDKKPISSSNDSLNSTTVFYTEQHMSKPIDTPEKSDLSFKAKLDFFENITPKPKEKEEDSSSESSSDDENKIKTKTNVFSNKIRNKFSKHKQDDESKEYTVNETSPKIIKSEIKVAVALPEQHASSSSSSSDDETPEKRREINTVILPHSAGNHPIAYNIDVLTIRDTSSQTIHSSSSVSVTQQQTITSDTSYNKQTSITSETSIPTPKMRTKKLGSVCRKSSSSSSSSDKDVSKPHLISTGQHLNQNNIITSDNRASFTSSFSFSSNDESRENISTDKRDSLSVMDAVATVIQQYRYSNPLSPPKQSSSGTAYTFKKTSEFKAEKSLDYNSKNTSSSIITAKFSPLNSSEWNKEANNVYEIQRSDVVKVKSILLESDSSSSEISVTKPPELGIKKLRVAPAPPKPMESKKNVKINRSNSSSSSSSSSDEDSKKSVSKNTYEEQEATIYLSDNNVYEC